MQSRLQSALLLSLLLLLLLAAPQSSHWPCSKLGISLHLGKQCSLLLLDTSEVSLVLEPHSFHLRCKRGNCVACLRLLLHCLCFQLLLCCCGLKLLLH